MTEIRRAQPADLPVVLDLIRQLARYEKLESQFVVTIEQLQVALFGERPAAEVWLAEIEGQPVGYATTYQTFSTFLGKPGLFLEDLFVLESSRGQGVGTDLFCFVANLARERGCGRMEWTALDWNEPALKFYASKGAITLNDWKLLRLDEAALQKL